ncbi:MAG: GNAT family N-acetyltransferase [Candidatus Omnitrophota bacterium]
MLQTSIHGQGEAGLYQKLFDDCPHALVQQSIPWSYVIAPISPDVPYFLVVRNLDDGEIVAGLPLYYYEGRLGGILTSVPHAGPLGGILCLKNLDDNMKEQVYRGLMKCAIELADTLKCISISIITNPFLDDEELYITYLSPTYILKNFCQAIDLKNLFNSSNDYTTGNSNHNNDIRRNLSKASRYGIVVDWADDDDFEAWYDIHVKRHCELKARPLPKILISNILSSLKPLNMANLAVIRKDADIIGGCIYIWNREIMDVFILSSETELMKYGGNYALTDFAIRYFYKNGIRWFNWQSSNPNSGVYAFKNRWGSSEMPYSFLTWTFPGFAKILSTPLEEVLKAYPWHYIAPYDAIRDQATNGVFKKG